MYLVTTPLFHQAYRSRSIGGIRPTFSFAAHNDGRPDDRNSSLDRRVGRVPANAVPQAAIDGNP